MAHLRYSPSQGEVGDPDSPPPSSQPAPRFPGQMDEEEEEEAYEPSQTFNYTQMAVPPRPAPGSLAAAIYMPSQQVRPPLSDADIDELLAIESRRLPAASAAAPTVRATAADTRRVLSALLARMSSMQKQLEAMRDQAEQLLDDLTPRTGSE